MVQAILSDFMYTDEHQYLLHTPCHPNSCKKGIPFGQALRIRRICSIDAFFEKRAGELCGYLMNRGYNKKQVLREMGTQNSPGGHASG